MTNRLSRTIVLAAFPAVLAVAAADGARDRYLASLVTVVPKENPAPAPKPSPPKPPDKPRTAQTNSGKNTIAKADGGEISAPPVEKIETVALTPEPVEPTALSLRWWN